MGVTGVPRLFWGGSFGTWEDNPQHPVASRPHLPVLLESQIIGYLGQKLFKRAQIPLESQIIGSMDQKPLKGESTNWGPMRRIYHESTQNARLGSRCQARTFLNMASHCVDKGAWRLRGFVWVAITKIGQMYLKDIL